MLRVKMYMKKVPRIVVYHVLVWLVYHGIICFGLFVNGNFTSVKDVGYYYLANLPFILAFYLIFFLVFTKPGAKGKLTPYLWLVVTFLVIYLLARYINNELMPYTGKYFPWLSRELLADTLINFLQHFLYAFLYWQFVKRVGTEKQLRLSETEKLKAEYNYLKSQINPHFLYNTLDYFYAWMLKHDKKQAEGLAILGQLMRYSLAVGDSEGKVKLRDEAEQIEHYIQLQQLRYDGKLNIRFDCPEIPRNLLIVPHLLITLVENAFKYGVTSNWANPVVFQLVVKGREIMFTAENHISPSEKDKARTGIGLKNLEQRLNIEYAGKHDYQVETDGAVYRAMLSLSL
jgi:two-component system, LytTR family, sensor kinase